MSRPWQVGDIVENPECEQRGMITATREGDPTYARPYNREIWVREVVCSAEGFGWRYQGLLEEWGWRLVEPKVLIPPGTPTHVFTDIPDDDLLTSREGHPHT